MTIIDLNRIREALPSRAEVTLTKYNGRKVGEGSLCLQCFVPSPSLSEKEFEQCKQWQREILGKALMGFYTEETGRHWFVYLNRIPMEFINCQDKDINSYTGMNLVENGVLAKQNGV